MQTSIRQNTTPSQEQVACVAYGLWEKAGRPSGRDLEFWLKAEQQIARASRPRMFATTPDEQRPKASPPATPASAVPSTTTTAFEWKARSQIENRDQSGNEPAARPTSTHGKRSASNRPARSR